MPSFLDLSTSFAPVMSLNVMIFTKGLGYSRKNDIVRECESKMPQLATLELRKDAKPIRHTPRRIAFTR
jgi:hypothetical protein